MLLFCAKCRVYFEMDEVVYKVEVEDRAIQFLYYHKGHIPKGSKIIAKGTARAVIASLDNGHKNGKMIRKICDYDKCRAVFCTTDKHRKFCSDNCYDAHAREKEKIRNLTRCRRVGNTLHGRWGDGRNGVQLALFG